MIGFDDDGNVMGGRGNIADSMDAAVAAVGEAMAGAQGMGGPLGSPSQSGEDALDESNPTNPAGGRPTANFNSATLAGNMRNAANRVGSFLSNFSPTRAAMSLLAKTGDLTPTMSFMAGDPLAMNAPITTAGIPGYLGQNYGVGTITDVAMSGSGAHMAPATSIQNWGGQDVHVGPGYQMNMAGIEDGFFPGYGVNPYSGVAMADPSDPYIRKNRGSEIVAMIGA